MNLAEKACRVRPGNGLVGRFPALVFVTSRPATDLGNEIVATLRTLGAEGTPGKRVARQLARILTAADDDAPGFGVVADDPDGTVIFVHGHVAVTAQIGDTEMKLSGVESATWIDRVVTEPVRNFSITRLDVPVEPADPFTELREGVTPGSGVSVAAGVEAVTGDTDGEAPPPLPPRDETEVGEHAERLEGEDDEPDDEVTTGHQVIDLGEPVEERRNPLPLASDTNAGVADQVLGVRCSRGHFNEPNALHCAACGIAMVHLTKIRTLGPRPALGFLIFDDGTTYTLDAPYVVGRDPAQDDNVVSGQARPLVVNDPELFVSRTHAIVDLHGWDIVITDRSTHGTYVWAPGDATWTRLDPGQSYRLRSGTQVQLGGAGGESGRRFTVDSPHHR